MPNPPPDPSVNALRRRAPAPDAAGDSREGVDPAGLLGLDQLLRPKSQGGPDDVDSLLERYQAEKYLTGTDSAQGLRRGSGPGFRNGAAGTLGDGHRPTPPRGLPPLTRNAELERLQAENADLRQLTAELRELLEANDPALWEQRVAEAEQLVAAKDEELAAMLARVDEWEARFKTHRFVPHEDDLAKEADEFDKERARLAQERKQLEADRQQLKDDEEAMMKQMRDMEIGMAKDRAELARQRTELQRLHNEIKHELELMQRGDASVKDRLAQFQRRYQETVLRSTSPPPAAQTPPPMATPLPPAGPAGPAASPTPRPRDASVLKKFFGKE